MRCICTSAFFHPSAGESRRVEVGEEIDLSPKQFARLHDLGCAITLDEHEMLAEGEAEKERFSEEVRRSAADLRARALVEPEEPQPDPSPVEDETQPEEEPSSDAGVTLDLGAEPASLDAKLAELEACESRDELRDFARKHDLAEQVDLRKGADELRSALETVLLAD